MKHLVIGLILGILVNYACSMGGKSAKLTERKDQSKMWRACQDSETAEALGHLCNRVCLKRGRKGACKEWKTNVKNFCGDDFYFFRNTGNVFLPERYLYL